MVATVPDGIVNIDVAGPPLNVNTATIPKTVIGLLMLNVNANGVISSGAVMVIIIWVSKLSA